jgi:3-phenylpropionate/trans-cinnamate dioxygenase ferredoxin reductase subunit
LSDCRSLIKAAGTAKNVVVIGASFIGLEVAASLKTRGLSVEVVAPETTPLERVVGHELGAFVEKYHTGHGIQFHLGRKPQGIDKENVTLDDGTRLAADLVVMGVGVKPRLALAEDAGLTMDRGVVVDSQLRTSVPDIYAAGDIARFPDARTGDKIRVEHWIVAERMGQAAARNMLGAEETFTEVPVFWSAHYDTTILYVGHAEKWDSLRTEGDPMNKDVSVDFVLGGSVRANATINRDKVSLQSELAMESEHDGGSSAHR